MTEKEYDPKSGLMFYNSRWYDPAIGRFTQADAFKGFAGSTLSQNPYAYVGNNPINNIDPTGHAAFERNVPLYVDDVYQFDVELWDNGRTYFKGTDDLVRDAFEGTGYTVEWDASWNNGKGRVNVYSDSGDDGDGGGDDGDEPKSKADRQQELKAVAGLPQLKKGASGAQVALLQNLLIAKGYKISAGATGNFLGQTEAAVNAFKKNNKLGNGYPYSGIVGVYTWATLLSGKAVRGDIETPAPKQRITSKLSKKEFVEAVFKAAQNDELITHVPAAITTAQAILESSYGRKVPSDVNSGKYSYNLFGIKGKGPAGSVSSWTHEVIKGKRIKVLANFRAYNNFEESIQGHSAFLLKNKRYKFLFKTSDPIEWAKGLQNAGMQRIPAMQKA